MGTTYVSHESKTYASEQKEKENNYHLASLYCGGSRITM